MYTQARSATDPGPMTTQQKTLSTLSSSSSSSDSSSSEPSVQALRPPVTLGRSVSGSNRQSVFLGHGEEEGESSSRGPNPNDDQEDMKEVEIETEDPSHLFWVCVHRSQLFLCVMNRWAPFVLLLMILFVASSLGSFPSASRDCTKRVQQMAVKARSRLERGHWLALISQPLSHSPKVSSFGSI